MKYLHRYDLGDGVTAYVVGDKATGPIHSAQTLDMQKWRGRAIGGNVPQIISRVDGISNWSKEETDAPEEVAVKKAAEELDKMAEELQPENEHLAKYIDQVSDYLEGN